MEIKDRIKVIMERENLAPGTFAENIGIQQSTLSHILNGRNNPSLDVIMKVHQRYNYINLEWLLYGIGNLAEKGSSTTDYLPSLFDENLLNSTQRSDDPEYRKEIAFKTSENAAKETVKQEIRYIERPLRKITEIRIFFDDNTYETFKGEK
ncbi:helix-turn-helix transcriptional regulator [uncultured Bacteroides sp.]|uniref:helix-turn-helix domain-containing protein n=1 Tax=uncultured Bacteroides sp. TaxID=162156 RepID=UPI002AA5F974|nr:helix-turn-helix transcriptional regulator [uncultured Bacteroides sp.]